MFAVLLFAGVPKKFRGDPIGPAGHLSGVDMSTPAKKRWHRHYIYLRIMHNQKGVNLGIIIH